MIFHGVQTMYQQQNNGKRPVFSLPENAQALYLHLNMQADDDGFINNAASVSVRIKGGAAALKKLVEKRFILQFDDVYVIKHWRISNSLKNDRLRPLSYASIAQKIWVKPNKAYTDHPVPDCITLYETRTGTKPPGELPPNGTNLESGWNPDGIHLDSGWNPNLTKPNITKHNLTEPKVLDVVWKELLRIYPQNRTGNTDSAYEAFRQVATNGDTGWQMVESLRLWMQSEQWNKDDGKYIPYLVNWILRGTWAAKPDKMAIPKGASGELGEAEMDAIRRVLTDDSLCGC